MKLTDYLKAIVADLKANATFLKDVSTHGRVLGAAEIQRLMMTAPACRIALLGTRGGSRTTSRSINRGIDTMGRAATGEFRGPMTMAAFVIDEDKGTEDAQDRVVGLVDQLMTFLEHRTFGLNTVDVGPALITGFEILYDPAIADLGAAVAVIGFEQEVWFGRNLHLEDPAQIQPGWPIPPDGAFTEQDWINVGIDPLAGAKPHAKARAKWPEGASEFTTGKAPEEVLDPETNPDHHELDVEDNKTSGS